MHRQLLFSSNVKFLRTSVQLPYLLNWNGYRQFCTTANKQESNEMYFKKVLHSSHSSGKKGIDIEAKIAELQEHQKMRQKQKEELREARKHQEKFGLTDYEVEDFQFSFGPQKIPRISQEDIDSGEFLKDNITKNAHKYEVVNQLDPNKEVAVFGLPFDTNITELQSIFSSFKGTVLNIDKDLNGDPSHAIIKFQGNSHLDSFLSNPPNLWIRNKKLKIRSSRDKFEESVQNRTIVVGNIPVWISENSLLNFLSSYGRPVAIDMPTIDIREEEALNVRSQVTNDRKLQRRFEERVRLMDELFEQNADFGNLEPVLETQGLPLAERILNYEKEIQKRVSSHGFGLQQQNESKLDFLEKDKKMKVLTLCTIMHNEGEMVSKCIEDIKAERDKLTHRSNNIMNYPDLPSTTVPKSSEDLKEITPVQIENLQKYTSYILKNDESIPAEIISEMNKNRILEMLVNDQKDLNNNLKHGIIPASVVSEGISAQIMHADIDVSHELANGYQWLLKALERREMVLKNRLHKTMRDYNNKDRVLADSLDFNNEIEDFQYDPDQPDHEDKFNMEDIISISNQMKNVTNWKENPELFKEDRSNYIQDINTPNFNKHDIETAPRNEKSIEFMNFRLPINKRNEDMTEWKNTPRVLNSYDRKILDQMAAKIELARSRMDLPFDEMYHNEKALIQNVVAAELDLKEALKNTQKDLSKHASSLRELYNNDALSFLYETEDEDIRTLLNHTHAKTQNSDSLFVTQSAEANTFNTSIEDCLNKLKDDYLKKLDDIIDRKIHSKNKGYCFVTFSHTDDVKRFMLMSQEGILLDSHELDIFLKNDLTHAEFDPGYLKARTIADAKIIDKKDKLKAAKQKLKEYEDKFEEKMPKSYKLNLLREHAKDKIDGNTFIDRSEFPRSTYEEERVKHKIQQMEGKTGKDLSFLYEDEKAEIAKIQKHKKAFDTYKSYAFLKAGLRKTPMEQRLTEVEKEEKPSPMAYLKPDNVMKKFVRDDYKVRLLDEGIENNKLGRKFNYTKEDFIESYFGKDLMRERSLSLNDDRPIYSFNDEMKKEYSYDKLSQIPSMEREQELFNQNYKEAGMIDTEHKDPDKIDYIENLAAEQSIGEYEPKYRYRPPAGRKFKRRKRQRRIRMGAGAKKKRQNRKKAIQKRESEAEKEYTIEELKAASEAGEKWQPIDETADSEDISEQDMKGYKRQIYQDFMKTDYKYNDQRGRVGKSILAKKFLEEIQGKTETVPPIEKSQIQDLHNFQNKLKTEASKEAHRQKFAEKVKKGKKFRELNYKKDPKLTSEDTSGPKTPTEIQNEIYNYRLSHSEAHPDSLHLKNSLKTDETYLYKHMRANSRSEPHFSKLKTKHKSTTLP